jgi:hypothetical protein
MSEQFLILHKVRGQPQLDMAEKCMIGDEEGWVLCTCGHRAYPYLTLGQLPLPEIGEDFAQHPEHYPQKPEPKHKIDISLILSSLIKFKRRL